MDPWEEILRLPIEKLVVWQAFLELEPPAADRADLREAFHTAVLANRLQMFDDGSEPITVDDMLLDWEAMHDGSGDPVTEDPEAEADALVAAINARFG